LFSLGIVSFLIWEGTCIGFFIDLLLQCQVPRTTPCLLSHLSHPISRHLIFAHEFKFSIKTTSIFEKFPSFCVLALQAGISAPRAEYSGGPDYPGHSGWIIRPGIGWLFKGRGQAALGQFLPHPVLRLPAAATTLSSPPPGPRPSPWPDFAGS
jgi:hypothetical protein